MGTKDFNVAGTSTKDISINWTVTAGDHQIFGQIENAKFLTSTGTYVSASLADNVTSKSSRTVANKLIAQNISNGINTVDGAFNSAIDSIQNIGSATKSNLPVAISQSATATTNTLDGLRGNIGTTLGNAQAETQKNINNLNDVKDSSKNNTDENYIQKPFEYVELFFLSILGAIFSNKILFYVILILIVLWLLRYLWLLIF